MGLVSLTLNYFLNPQTDQMCTVFMHTTQWPQLAITGLTEYVLAARVVVFWENSKWALLVVAMAWVGVIGSIVISFALGTANFPQEKVLSPGLDYYTCVGDKLVYIDVLRMWFLFLGYNTLLGLMIVIKGVTSYRQEVLRGSRSQLREIVIRGSVQYYFIIIVLDIAVLCILQYCDFNLGLSASSMVLYITVIIACRLILRLNHAYCQPVLVGEPMMRPGLSSAGLCCSGPPKDSERIDLHPLGIGA